MIRLQNLPESQRVYDTKLKAEPLSPAELEELRKAQEMTSSLYFPRPSSRAASARPHSRLASKGTPLSSVLARAGK